jgi:hypothetical protein
LTELIQSRLVSDRDLIEEIAKVAFSFHTVVLEGKERIDVSFAPIAPKRPLLSVINIGQLSLCLTVLIIVLRILCQWLNYVSERY